MTRNVPGTVLDLLHDGIYLVAVLPLLVVARRYAELPAFVPLSADGDGRVLVRGPRWTILAAALLVAVLLPFCAVLLTAGRDTLTHGAAGFTLLQLLLIEAGIFSAVVLGLDVELALGRLRRSPAFVHYCGAAILGATVVLTLANA